MNTPNTDCYRNITKEWYEYGQEKHDDFFIWIDLQSKRNAAAGSV